MQKRISKEKAIEIILEEIEKGITFSECFSAKFSKFQLSEKTFSTYWNEAQEIHQKNQDEIKERVKANKVVQETENRIRELLSKERKREILQSIIEGEEKTKIIKVSKGVKIEFEVAPSLFERMKAIEIDNNMNGDNAPTKNENKHSFDLDFNKWLEDGDIAVKDEKQEIPHFEHLK